MLVRDKDWELIRTQFTEEEKAQLREAVTGEVICPQGWTIDPDQIPEPLRTKHAKALLTIPPH
jgi:hypothetical protein